MSVRDRILALEARRRTDEDGQPPPIVYPLHYKRFIRRTPIIHAPQPVRSIPTLQTPPEPSRLPTPQSQTAIENEKTPAIHDHISPASFLHGTRSRCHRHGRFGSTSNVPARGKFAGTRDMTTKSRSGAYIPTGQTTRRQLEVTDPFLHLTKHADAKMKGSDPCPDCFHKLRIKRRELLLRRADNESKMESRPYEPISNARSVPELLEVIDQASKEIGEIYAKATPIVSNPRPYHHAPSRRV